MGMVAVLVHAYALRHGYDYLQVVRCDVVVVPLSMLPHYSIHSPDPRLPSLCLASFLTRR